jgi:hypothetical protein
MWWRNYRHLRRWRTVLAHLNLKETESSGFGSWRATLQARTGDLNIWLTNLSGEADRVLVTIEGPPGFSIVKLRRQILKLWTREIELGDAEFDDKFIVEGENGPVCALLGGTLRRQLLRAVIECDSLDIGNGGLVAKIPEQQIRVLLPLLLDISRRFAEPLNVKARLIQNARRDPKSGVRLTNLLLLVREFPDDPEALQALRQARTDQNFGVRVQAAIALGDEGYDTLLGVVMKSPDDEAGAQAIKHLGGKLNFEQTKKILTRALNKGYPRMARACLEVLGQRRTVAIGTLTRVMTTRKGELAAAAALALGATGEEAAQAPLLQALQSDDGDLREAAAKALGKVGTADAVQPLKDAAERFWLSLGLRRAARQAIAEIHTRLGATPGQLSLAEAEAGQLSLAEGETGRLSFPQEGSSPSHPMRPGSGRSGELKGRGRPGPKAGP